MSSAVPRLNLSSVGASTITTPNIPGMRFNGYIKTARGAGRICNFDTKYGFPTEGACQTSRTARNNYNAVSITSSQQSRFFCFFFLFQCYTNSLTTCHVFFLSLSFFLSLFLFLSFSLSFSFSLSLSITLQSGRKENILEAQKNANIRAETARLATGVPTSTTSSVKPWERDTSETYVFYAYYQETVPESREENNRYRCFAIRW